MLKRIGLLVYIFMIIYYPPILTIHGMRVVAMVAWFLMLINIRGISKRIKWTEVLKVISAGVAVIFYVMLVALIHGNEFIPSIAGFVYCVIAFVPAGIVVAFLAESMQLDLFSFIDLILKTAMLQSIISISAMLIPSLKNILISWMLRGHVFQETTYSYALILRMFGYSTGLTYGMPIVQTFLAMCALFLTFEKKFKYIIYVPFLLISAFINSRTAAVVAAVCLIIFLIVRRQKLTTKTVFRSVFIILNVIAVIMVLPRIVETFSPETYAWVQTGYGEIFRFTKGDTSTGYFNYLTDVNRWRLPVGLDLLFGTGIRVMSGNNSYSLQSDIGYINDLWLGGILLTVMTYFFWIRRILKIKNYAIGNNKDIQGLISFIWISFLAIYLIINVKGYAFDLNNFTALFILFISYLTFTVNAPLSNYPANQKYKRIRFTFGRRRNDFSDYSGL